MNRRVSAENLPSARVVEQDGVAMVGAARSRADARPRIVAGSLFVVAVVAIAAVAAWPIYRDWSFLLLVGVCVARRPPRSPRSPGAAAGAAGVVAGLAGDRLPRARHPARRARRASAVRSNSSGARRRRSRRAVRVEGPGHGRPARRHVPQPARARARRVPGRAPARCCCCRGAASRVGVRRGAGGARDGLVRAVLRPHDRERAARHRPGRDLRARRDRARASPACSRACCGWRGAVATSGCARCSVPRHPAASASRAGRRGPIGVAPRSERGCSSSP